MVPDGVKTSKSDKKVSDNFVETHIKIGIDALKEIKYNRLSVKHLKFG
jgi:AMP nucleosidase